MFCEYEVRRVKGKIDADIIIILFLKAPRGQPGLMSSSNRQITTNSSNVFTYPAMGRNLRFNTYIFGTETSDTGSAPSPVPGRN